MMPEPFRIPANVREAIAMQEALRGRVIRHRTFEKIRTLGAVDCAHKSEGFPTGVAGIVVYRYPELIELSRTVIEHPVSFPYVPGLLSFREIPLILAAVESLSQLPDLFLVDGQGIAHPRRLGIASHLGLVLDRPAIGCAKSILTGRAPEPANAPGSTSDLMDRGEVIGRLLRIRANVKPVVVSLGHRIDLDSAVEIVTSCADGLRIPKPIREVDRLVGDRLRHVSI